MKIFYTLLLLLSICFAKVQAQDKKQTNILKQEIVWSAETLENTALQEGMAGTFFGKYKQWIICAGGSSFPEGKPWQGGKKYFSNHVLVFDTFSDSEKEKLSLIYQGTDLPESLAEGAYTSLPQGILCIGGQTPEGVSASVYLLSFENNKIQVKKYPNLPTPVKNATATTLGSAIYVIGGQLADGTSSNQFLKLDTQSLEEGWQTLPEYPLAVYGSTAVTQQDGEDLSIFVFGGRNRNKNDATTLFYSDVYTYKPIANQWVIKKNIQLHNQKIPLAVATSTPVGASNILLFGGDTGHIFNQVEKAINSENTTLRDSLWQNHPGFQNEILLYNTITDEWFSNGKNKHPVAVTSSFSDSKHIYIVGGEKTPGVRSPYIEKLTFTKRTHFGWINYLVLILYFGGMLFVGFFFMKNNNNTEDYFKASGRIPWWAAGISIFATTLSAITFISIPAKTYATDWRMLMFNMTIILAVPIIIRFFLPFFLRFNFDTAYQYLEVRFSRSIRWIASGLFTFFMISRIAIVLFLPSLALNAVTGFSVYYAILIMSIVTIIYSTSGGMEAVVWGDVIQGFVLVIGALSAFAFMIVGIKGGFAEFWNTAIEYNKFNTFDFRLNWREPTLWVVLLGGLANTLISYTSDQSVVQRYMSTVNEKATAKSIWLNGIISVPVSILFFLLGTGLFAFYKSNADKMVISNANIDSVFPEFIVSQMPIGFAGLLIAAIFAAAMSTLSSNINSVSAVITSDFYKTWFKNTSFINEMRVARWSGIVIGLLGTAMAIILAKSNITSLWDQFNTFLGLITSGLGALFILGIFFPRVGTISAFVGLVCGIIILYWVKSETSLSFLLYGLIGMASSVGIAAMLSIFIPNKKEIQGFTWFSRKK